MRRLDLHVSAGAETNDGGAKNRHDAFFPAAPDSDNAEKYSAMARKS